jgi:NADPH-dependent 2,4-dienoyl-CoA reductase/sulfur reductase-like enzyme
MHPSLWVREAAPLPEEPAPPPQRADVAVIGGGIAGIATALHLARAGARPVHPAAALFVPRRLV